MTMQRWCCCGQRFCVAVVALLALLAGLVIKLSSIHPSVRVDVLSPSSPPPAVRPLTDDEARSYLLDGVLFAPNLLSRDDAAALAREAEEEVGPGAAFTLLDLATDLYSRVLFDAWRTSEAFATLALRSLPPTAARLVDASSAPSGGDGDGDGRADAAGAEDGKIRLLRDAYFAYSSGNRGCGWHVDDEGFWPTDPSTSGLTVWIALDPMRASEGGGVAVANATRLSEEKGDEWAEECRPRKTCAMEEEKPECHAVLEATKLQWDMEPGDAVLWDRWTYHRGVPMVDRGPSAESEPDKRGDVGTDGREGKVEKLRRYSVRYMPASSRALGMVHSSVAQGSAFDSPYYPQVWPNLLETEVEALRQGLEGDATLLNVLRSVVPLLRQSWRSRNGQNEKTASKA